MNLQFCAAVLRLADILDFDRERTPKILYSSLGIEKRTTPGNSVTIKEWNKHISVHTLNFKKDEILISANCANPIIDKAIRDFAQVIEKEIRDTLAVIKNNKQDILDDYRLEIPVIVRTHIKPDKYVFKDYSLKLNERAIINLLKGENLYQNRSIAFREIIQNSIDACTIKQFEDKNYEPQISVFLNKEERSVTIKDNGIGMDDYVISKYFLDIGSSYYSSYEFKSTHLSEGMNFNPISRFGIGLLSVFLLGDRIEMKTRNNTSPRKDKVERTLTISNKFSLAYVTQNTKSLFQGTNLKIYLRANETILTNEINLFKSIKDFVVRPSIPINIILSSKNNKIITPDNFVRLDKSYFNSINSAGDLEMLEINVEKFSDTLRGKIFLLLFKCKNGLLSYKDPKGKMIWEHKMLKPHRMFSNYTGQIRVTVNGFSINVRRLGAILGKGQFRIPSIIDIDIVDNSNISFDVSRSRIIGSGKNNLKIEMYKAIKLAFSEKKIDKKIDKETKNIIFLAERNVTLRKPIDPAMKLKIKELIPQGKWEYHMHKEIAKKLNVSNEEVVRYITAMIHLNELVKPSSETDE